MCRTSGARHRYTPGTQRSRAGLTSDAPTALQEKKMSPPKPTLQRRRKEPTSPTGGGARKGAKGRPPQGERKDDAPTALQEKRRCRPKGRRYKGRERNRPLRQEPELGILIHHVPSAHALG